MTHKGYMQRLVGNTCENGSRAQQVQVRARFWQAQVEKKIKKMKMGTGLGWGSTE